MLPLDVTVLDMDLGGLRETRELLVRGLGRNDAGLVGPEAIKSHREAAAKQGMEFHEPSPRFVEQNIVAQMADLLDDHLRVVDCPVIGALLDDGDAEWPLALPCLLVG